MTDKKRPLLLLPEFGMELEGGALVVVGAAVAPKSGNKLEVVLGALFAEVGWLAALPFVAVLPEGAVATPKGPPAGTVAAGAKGAAVGAVVGVAAAGCGGGRGNGAGGLPCVGASG